MPGNSMEVEHLKVYFLERGKLVLRSVSSQPEASRRRWRGDVWEKMQRKWWMFVFVSKNLTCGFWKGAKHLVCSPGLQTETKIWDSVTKFTFRRACATSEFIAGVVLLTVITVRKWRTSWEPLASWIGDAVPTLPLPAICSNTPLIHLIIHPCYAFNKKPQNNKCEPQANSFCNSQASLSPDNQISGKGKQLTLMLLQRILTLTVKSKFMCNWMVKFIKYIQYTV